MENKTSLDEMRCVICVKLLLMLVKRRPKLNRLKAAEKGHGSACLYDIYRCNILVLIIASVAVHFVRLVLLSSSERQGRWPLVLLQAGSVRRSQEFTRRQRVAHILTAPKSAVSLASACSASARSFLTAPLFARFCFSASIFACF